MNEYVVAYNDAADSAIEQKVIEASSETKAILKFLDLEKDIVFTREDERTYDPDDLEQLQDWLYELYEANVSVIQI